MHTISSDKGTVNFDLESRQFDFTTARGWAGRGEISAMSGNDPNNPVDDLAKHNWAGQTPDQAFTVSFQYVGTTQDGGVNTGFDYVANIVKQANSKLVQVFGDVPTLDRPVIAPVEESELNPVALNTNGFIDSSGQLWLKARDSEDYFGPIAPKK